MINMLSMKKKILLMVALFATSILSSQTLRLTSIHIDEQKELRPHNNHIIIGTGALFSHETIYNYNGADILGRDKTVPLYFIGYYRTDLFLENKVGLYTNINIADDFGVVFGATYKYYDDIHKLYFIGGIGGHDDESVFDLLLEVGALYSYKHLDVRVTTGFPEYFSAGVGFNF